MQAAETLASNQPEDPRFLGFTSYAQVIYNQDNPDKKNVPHIYGVDERGKKRHIKIEDVLSAYGRLAETQGLPDEYEQLNLTYDENDTELNSLPQNHSTEDVLTDPFLSTTYVPKFQEQIVLVDEFPVPVKRETFSGSNAESPIRYFRAASLGVLASRWLQVRGQKAEPLTVTPKHEPYLRGLKNLESSEVRFEDGERRKKNKKILGAAIVLGLLASVAFLKHESDLDLESMAPTTTITDIPKEVSINVPSVPTVTTTVQNPVEEPTVPTTSEPKDETPQKPTPPVVIPPADAEDPGTVEPVDGGVAISNPVDNSVSPAIRVDAPEAAILNPIDDAVSQAVRVAAPEVIPEIGEPAVITFNTKAMPWTNAENLGIKDIKGFLQGVLDKYNTEYNRHFFWDHSNGMFWEGHHIINPAELADYYIVFQKMYSDL